MSAIGSLLGIGGGLLGTFLGSRGNQQNSQAEIAAANPQYQKFLHRHHQCLLQHYVKKVQYLHHQHRLDQ